MSGDMVVSRPNTPTNFLRWGIKWLEPRSQDRDEAFRERSIRLAIALIISLGLMSFGLTIGVFRNPWAILSMPSLHVMVLSGCAASAYIISRGRIHTAAWVVILTLLIGATGYLVFIGQQGFNSFLTNGLPFFLLIEVTASLVLPRKSLWLVCLAAVALYGITVFVVSTLAPVLLNFNPTQVFLSGLLILPAVGVILHRLRIEFDARLDAMRESIQQAEAARQQAEADRKRAEEADKAKSQFLANMSHELRTPLNAIIGYDEAMLGGMVGEFAPNQLKLLGHIQHNSRRLLGLINDILDLSKIESGSLPVFLSPISPHKVIEETIDSLRSLADEKKIELTAQFSDAVPEVVLGDTKKLQQILVNLVSNAIKFTDEGSVTVNVSIVDTNRWLMEVRDTGIGIPADALNTIFEPFQQVDSTDKRKYKGTGLGLAITKRLVESLSGKIEVKSTLGEGSTFSVILPRAQVPEVAVKPVETAAKEIAS